MMKNIVLFLLCFSVLSCSSKIEHKESKPTSSVKTKSVSTEKELMSTAIYKMSVKNGGSIDCSSDKVQLRLYSDLSISLSGILDCGFFARSIGKGSIDLAKSFKFSNLPQDESTPEETKLKGILIRAKNIAKDSEGSLPIGGYEFIPARPHVINPLANLANLEEMKDEYKELSSVTVRTSDGKIIKDEGAFKIKVESISESIPTGATNVASKNNKVIHYYINTEGFNNVPLKGNFMLFDNRYMWMGTNPVVIYKMQMKSMLKDVVEGLADTANYDLKELLYDWATNGGQTKVSLTFELLSYTPNIDSDDEEDEDEDEDEDD